MNKNNQEPLYVKHFFIGDKRAVSELSGSRVPR